MTKLGRIWNKVVGWVRGLLPRAAPVAPGYTVEGATWSARGWIATGSLTAPRRAYLLHVPAGYSAERPAPLVVWIHGCQQSPEQFAGATRIIRWADELGWLVLMPRQTRSANVGQCWNWFDRPTANGQGEAAIVLAQIAAVEADHAIDGRRIFVAGLSSGAALAAVLAVRASDRFAAAAFHSGIACGAAASVYSAPAVMNGRPELDVGEIGRRARVQAARPIELPALIIQGLADRTVGPGHARELTRQMLALNGDEETTPGVLRTPDRSRESEVGGRRMTTEDFDVQGRASIRVMSIDGLAHAWSGGDDRFEYSDPSPPDATRLMLEFFRAATVGVARAEVATDPSSAPSPAG